jgi:hypothetical protein
MSNSSLSFTLLILFTSPERALSIQGDLTEEARTRGRIWFWSQVIRTTGALWWRGFTQFPFAILRLTLSGGATWFLVIAGLLAVELIAQSLGVPIAIAARDALLLGALLTGMILGRAAPVQGMYAAVALAFASAPILALLFFTPMPYAGIADLRLPVLVLAVTLLLLGSALSRRRTTRKARATH